MEQIGFIGLGTMGSAMASNIHAAGYRLTVWNRSPEKAEHFKQRNIAVAASPAELAAACDTVVIMVFGPEALREVLQGPRGLCRGLKAGALVVNMSTVSRQATLEAAAAVSAAGGQFIDAPVSGSKKPAQDGTLTVLAGGDRGLVERATPLLKTMGSTVIYCGPAGQGTAMKLFINLFLGTLMQSLAEALCMGAKMGLSTADMLATIQGSAVACPMFKIKGDAIARGDFTKSFSVDLLFKDLSLLLAEAGSLAVPLPLAAAARESFSAARALGLGDEDMAAVIKVLEKLTGVPARAGR